MNSWFKTIIAILAIIMFQVIFCSFLMHGQVVPKLKKLSEKNLNVTVEPQRKKDLWGYANEKGKFVIKPVFSSAWPFNGGIAIVEYKGKWGVLNRDATFLFPPQFDSVDDFMPYGDGSYSIVNLNGLYGMISSSGEIVCATDYDEVDLSFLKKYGLFVVKKGDKYGVCDIKGLRLKATYDQVILVSDGARANPKFCLALRVGEKWAIFGLNNEPESIPDAKYHSPDIFGQKGIVGLLDILGDRFHVKS